MGTSGRFDHFGGSGQCLSALDLLWSRLRNGGSAWQSRGLRKRANRRKRLFACDANSPGASEKDGKLTYAVRRTGHGVLTRARYQGGSESRGGVGLFRPVGRNRKSVWPARHQRSLWLHGREAASRFTVCGETTR